MNKTLAQFISVICHPVLMPTYALLLIFSTNSFLSFTIPAVAKFILYTIIVINTLLLPVLISYLLIRRGWIRSFEMERREERLFPFITNLLLLLVASFMIYRLHLPRVFYLLTLGAAASVLIAIFINLKWKISIHMIGIGGLIGTFFGMSSFLMIDLRMHIIFCLLLAGLIGTARMTLGAHHSGQIYGGFFVGFLCEYVLLSI